MSQGGKSSLVSCRMPHFCPSLDVLWTFLRFSHRNVVTMQALVDSVVAESALMGAMSKGSTAARDLEHS